MTRCLSRRFDHRAGDNLVAIGFNGGGLGGLLAFKCLQGGGKIVHVIQAVLGVRLSVSVDGGL